MSILYNETNKLIQLTWTEFKKVEKSHHDVEQIDRIEKNIEQIKKNLEKLAFSHLKAPLHERATKKSQFSQLDYDLRHLATSLEALKERRRRREREKIERTQLLHSNNDVVTSRTSSSTTIQIDQHQHHHRMSNVNRDVDSLLSSGAASLEALRHQRHTMKVVQKRIRDAATILGLSDHTMRMIERRVGEDKFLFIGGALVTLVVIFLIIFLYL